MKLFLRLLSLLLPFSWLVLLAIFLGCATVVSNMILLSVAAYLISAAALAPLIVTLELPMYIVRFMGVSRAVSRYFERLSTHNVAFRLLARLRSQLFGCLAGFSQAQLLTLRSGDLLARLVSDCEELQNFYVRMASPLLIWLVITVFTWLVLSVFSTLLAWFVVACLLIAGLVIPLLSLWLARSLGRQQIMTLAKLKIRVVDAVQGMADVLLSSTMARQDYIASVSELDTVLTRTQKRMARVTGFQQALHEWCSNMTLLGLLVLAIPLVNNHSINGIYLAFLLLLVLGSFETILPVAQALQLLGHALTAGERVFQVVDTSPQLIDVEQPLPAPATPATLEFREVHFAYQQAEGPVLQDISFTVTSGSHIAIVGPSGSGKSTLLKLLLRTWRPDQGQLLLNDHDIGAYKQQDLLALYSVVDQDTFLYNDTLRNNLLLAQPDASDDQILMVLEQVGLTALLQTLPAGLDTWIGEQGLRLSGGERQRVAIARALLKDAPILLLDEATAHLDPITEHTLLHTLQTLMQERTTLMVTHRLVGLETMDTILVLDQGRIVQQGTHAQLKETTGLYQQLLTQQNELLPIG